MILLENNSVCHFSFIGKEGFDGHPESLSVRNTLGV